MKGTRSGILVLSLMLSGLVAELKADPVGTGFTYQGKLQDCGAPAQGTYDFAFALYDDPVFGNVLGGPIYIEDKDVHKGLFTVVLDFGDVYDGLALWLQVAVRPGASGDPHTPLFPRQPLTPTPYAIYATTADHGSLIGLGDDDHPQYVMHDETDSITTAMIQNQAVTGEKITSDTPAPGEVLQWNGTSIVWDTDDIDGGDCPWQTCSEGIHYDGHVGIGTCPDRMLHVVPDNSGIRFDMTQSTGVVHIVEGSPDNDCLEVDGDAVFDSDIRVGDDIDVEGDVTVGHNVRPKVDDKGYCGTSSYAWDGVFSYDFYDLGTRERGEEIESLGPEALKAMLNVVDSVDVVQVLCEGETLVDEPNAVTNHGANEPQHLRNTPHLGVLVETLPPEVLDPSGTGVRLMSYTAMLHAGVKELSARMKQQQTEIIELRQQLETLKQSRSDTQLGGGKGGAQ